MKYTRVSENRIICELDAGTCGSCRVNEHGIHDCMPGDTLTDKEGSLLCIGCGKKAMTETEGQEIWHNGIHEECRAKQVVNIATRFGSFDGAHHKQWVIDQMLRASLSKEKYDEWLEKMNSDTDYDPWDHGTPP